MKLWTEMKRDTDGEWFANDPDPNQRKGAIARGAVAAHALMMAMEEVGAENRDYSWLACVEKIERRADKIMAQWGFDSGEDA